MDLSSELDPKPSSFSNPFAIAFAVIVLATVVAIPFLWPSWQARESGAGNAAGGRVVSGGSGEIARGEPAALAALAPDADGTDPAPDEVDAAVPDGAGDTLAIREISAVEDGMEALVGGRIVLVSSREPGVVQLDDGQRFATGASLPNGHVIAAIERERIVLQRDGVVSVVRLP